MSETPTAADRAEALLAAPVGRRLVAEVAGVSFAGLLDQLDLPYPPNIARLRSGPRKPRRRRAWTLFGQRIMLDPLHRMKRSRQRATDVHRGAVLQARTPNVAAAVQRIRADSGRSQRVDVERSTAVLEALSRVIQGFGFWGNEKEYDHVLRAALDELRPVAEALVSSPATRWWWDDVERDDQRYAERTAGDGNGPPRGDQVAEQVAKAVKELRSDEADARKRHPSPSCVSENASGHWWSTPIPGLWTSRPVAPVPALHLACAEETNDERAVVWSLRILSGARVFEVRGPSDWSQLVAMAPIDVTMSRLSDWRRWTGHEGPFYLPDWSVIAEHFDGIHVTVGGFLTSRSVPVPVADGYSVLAGWDPDASLWLRDMTEAVERAGEWDGPFRFEDS